MHDAKLVHEELCSIARTRLELHAREARLLVLAEELELWRTFGCAHIFEYLERFCDLHPRTARDYLRVARALTVLPTMRAALDERIHYSTARELTRVATPANEAAWLRAVEGLSARAVEEKVAGHTPGDGPDDPKDPDYLVKLVLEIRESTFAMFMEARSRYMDERGDRMSDDEVVMAMCRERPAPSDFDIERVDVDADADADADADVDVDSDADASTRALADARAAAKAHPRRDGRVPPYRLSITTCRVCAKSYLLAAGRQVPVPPALLAAAQCDARVIGDLEADLPPRAFAKITPRMREQLLERDGHTCTVPGCRSKRFLDGHHVDPESNGGPTVLWNMTTLCAGHHHLLHEGKLRVAGRAPHQLTWRWPDDPERTSTRDRRAFAREPCGPRGPG